jgi:toxin ParE1/3/4
VKVEWSPLALDRVSEIARYIAKDNPAAAERWVNELFESVERLADYPQSGRVVPEVGVQRIREVILGAYRVIYSVKDKVEILTVRRGSQLLDVREIDDEHEQQDHGGESASPRAGRVASQSNQPRPERGGNAVRD